MSKKTLNITNLQALGAPRLAALLMEVSAGSADIKRRLRLELSHNIGVSELSRDVRKRFAMLRKTTSYVGWRKRKALIKDLDTQVSMIVDKIAPDDATAAFDLLWDFIALAPFIHGRTDDSKGDVGDVFRGAIAHFEGIAPHALVDPLALADRVWTALQDNGFGEWDGIIAIMAPALGTTGLAQLQAHLEHYAATPKAADDHDHAAIAFLRQLRGGDSYAADRKSRFVKRYLQEIAAATGDTAAYIAQYSDTDLMRPQVAAEVAALLLDDEQAQEALEILQNADLDSGDFGKAAWDTAYIACLTALDRTQDAQAHRWKTFTTTLNPAPLRDYLKQLPDFDDVAAEDEAKQHVLDFPHFSVALGFCLNWPDIHTAAKLVMTRTDEIDGDNYPLLVPAADALRTRHPLAAVLIWRALIDDALGQSRTTRYGHIADHLADCATLDAEITDYGSFLTHADYYQALQTRHKHKASFWAKLAKIS